MGTVIVDLTGDESRLARAYDIAEKKDKSLRDSLAATGKAGQSANEQIIRSFDQVGDKGTKAMNAVLKELRKLGPEGREAARAVEGRLREAGTHGRKSMDDVVKSLGKLSPEAAKVARDAVASLKKVEDQGKRSFGDDATMKLAKFAAGWISVSTAIGLAREAMQRVQAEQQKALDSLQQTSDPNKRLLQVASSEGDYKAMTAKADQLASKYGIGRDQARGLMFSARSENFEGATEFIARNAQILDVASQSTVAGQVPGLFKKEGLRPDQAINMGLVAAAESRLNFEQIAAAMPGAAEGGTLAGASSSETFGALSVLAGRFKSGETAADRIKAFTTAVGLDQGTAADDEKAIAKNAEKADQAQKQLRTLEERKDDAERALNAARLKGADQQQIDSLQLRYSRASRSVDEFDRTSLVASPVTPRQSLQGSGIIGAVEKLQAMTPDQRSDFLGEGAEVNAAYTILAEELQTIKARMTTIDAARLSSGTAASPIAGKLSIAESDPKLAALRRANAAEVSREIANENRNAIDEANRQAAVNMSVAGASNRGESKIGIAAGQMIADAAAGMGVDAGGLDRRIIGGDLATLSSSSSAAIDSGVYKKQGLKTLEAMKYGSMSLLKADSKAGPGGQGQLSATEAKFVLQQITGERIDSGDMTPQLIKGATDQVRRAAAANPGRNDWDFTGISSKLGGGATEDAKAIVSAVNRDEMIELLREQNAIMKAQAEREERGASQRSAPPVNYSAGLQSATSDSARP